MNSRVLVTSLIVAACVSVAGWSFLHSPEELPPRTTVLRVSLDQPYAECAIQKDQSAATERLLPVYQCSVAGGEREARQTNTRSGESYSDPHEDGVSDLIFASKYDGLLSDAIRKLGDAIYVNDVDAQRLALRHNDLAAAYFERALHNDDPRDLIRALDAVEQAAQLDPESERVCFNRAVVLQMLHLREQATGAWKHYLKLDATSSWAQEARQMLRELEWLPVETWEVEAVEAAADAGDVEALRRLVDANRGSAREYVEINLLRAWAEAAAAGDEDEAVLQLRRAEAIAAILSQLNGDRLALESVQVVETASGERRAALVEGYSAYSNGFELEHSLEFTAAREQFEVAESALTAAGSPLALAARFHHVLCKYFFAEEGRDLLTASRLLGELQDDLTTRSYPGLTTYVMIVQGLLSSQLNQLAGAETYLRIAQQASVKAGYAEFADASGAYLGSILAQLGDTETAWRFHYETLQALDSVTLVRQQQALNELGWSLQNSGFPHASWILLGEALYRVEAAGEDSLRAETLIRKAQTAWRLEKLAEAEGLLHLAESVVVELDPGLQGSYSAEIQVLQAQLLQASEPWNARVKIDQALDFFEQGNKFLGLDARLRRAELRAVMGELPAALEDLDLALASYEEQRTELASPIRRQQFFEQARRTFEAVVRAHVELRDFERAHDAVERLRARVLLESMVANTDAETYVAEPLVVGDLQAALSPSVAVVSYLALPDRLYAWRFYAGSMDFAEIAVSRGELRQLVEPLTAALQEDRDFIALAAELYSRLRGVGSSELPVGTPIVVVPDLALYEIPFPALIDGTGHPLIERHPLLVTPGVTFYLRSVERDRQLAASGYETALVVGNPPSERGELPGAEREAIEVAALYNVDPYLGTEATRAVFLEALTGGPSAVHVASHGTVDLDNPNSSALHLAPAVDGEDDGRLEARDLYQLRLPATRLVVLAACDSGRGLVTSTEGPLHLARPFLAAGVPAVVSSLWLVQDEESRQLLIRFHEELHRTGNPMRALQSVQVEKLQQPDGLQRGAKVWANLRLSGGVGN